MWMFIFCLILVYLLVISNRQKLRKSGYVYLPISSKLLITDIPVLVYKCSSFATVHIFLRKMVLQNTCTVNWLSSSIQNRFNLPFTLLLNIVCWFFCRSLLIISFIPSLVVDSFFSFVLGFGLWTMDVSFCWFWMNNPSYTFSSIWSSQLSIMPTVT